MLLCGSLQECSGWLPCLWYLVAKDCSCPGVLNGCLVFFFFGSGKVHKLSMDSHLGCLGQIALYVGMLLARLLAPMLSGVLSRFLCDAIWFKKYLAGCYSVLW